MREIEFRGYDKDTQRWHFGSYVRIENTTAYPMSPDPVGDKIKFEREQVDHFIYFTEITDWGLPTRKLRATVDPESVGQYTGVLSKDGARIYEGDILRMYNGDIALVEWFNGERSVLQSVGLHARVIHRSDVGVIDTADMKDIHREWGRAEILGTKYINPELLEGVDNE